MKPTLDKFQFFGVALDPSDDPVKVAFKHQRAYGKLPWVLEFSDPYDGLTYHLQDILSLNLCEKLGKMDVEPWLSPTPLSSDLPLVTTAGYSIFIDSDGCREYAEKVKNFVGEKVSSGKPVMIAVDHSMTGGVLKALMERYGSENILLIVLDSHFDAFQVEQKTGLVEYARDLYPHIPFIEEYPFTSEMQIDFKIPETYNYATFLKYLLDEEVILQENLCVVGNSDYPSEKMKSDERVGKYVEAYLKYEEEGVTFVTKRRIEKEPPKRSLFSILKNMEAPYVYISVDADVGALNAVYAARFMNVVGLNREQIYQLTSTIIAEIQCCKKTLIGFDVCEIETYLAGCRLISNVKDRTYEVLSDLTRMIVGQILKLK